jgi:hypothetical protein
MLLWVGLLSNFLGGVTTHAASPQLLSQNRKGTEVLVQFPFSQPGRGGQGMRVTWRLNSYRLIDFYTLELL